MFQASVHLKHLVCVSSLDTLFHICDSFKGGIKDKKPPWSPLCRGLHYDKVKVYWQCMSLKKKKKLSLSSKTAAKPRPWCSSRTAMSSWSSWFSSRRTWPEMNTATEWRSAESQLIKHGHSYRADMILSYLNHRTNVQRPLLLCLHPLDISLRTQL